MTTPQFIPTVEASTSVFLGEFYFDVLIKKFPQQDMMVSRISRFLSEASNEQMFSASKLHGIVRPPSAFILSEVLSYLVGTDVLKRIVRLSIGDVDIADYASVLDIPDEIFNPITQTMVTVMRENVNVWYQKQSADIQKGDTK